MRIRYVVLISLAVFAVELGATQAFAAKPAIVKQAATDPALAASLLDSATVESRTVQPVGGADPSAPANGTRRCYNGSWTKSWLEVAGAKLGQVEEDQKGFCASGRQRIDKDYGWHGQSWAWGPYCVTNYDSFHRWKDIPFSKIGTATGTIGINYPWGCGGIRTIHATHVITASGRTYGKW